MMNLQCGIILNFVLNNFSFASGNAKIISTSPNFYHLKVANYHPQIMQCRFFAANSEAIST